MRSLSLDLQKKLILSVGTKGSDRLLSPVEVAQAIDTELAAGTSLAELADFCGLTNSTMISRFHRLIRLAPDIQHMIGWGKGSSTLSFTVASHLARLSNPADQEALCKAALESALTTSEVQEIVQLVEGLHRTVAEAVDSVLKLRPRVKQLYAFIGLVTSTSVRAQMGTMSQVNRNRLLVDIVTAVAPKLTHWSGTLGTQKFTLVGEQAFADQIRGWPGGFDGFERALNEVLGREAETQHD